MVTPMPPIVAKRQYISPARAGFSRCKCDHTAASARFSPHPLDYRLQAPPIEDHTRRCTRFRRVPRPPRQRRQSPPATPASSVSPTIGRRLYHPRPLPLREQRSTPTTDAVSLSLPRHTQGSTTGNAPAHPKAHAFPAPAGFHLVTKTGFVSRLSFPRTRRFPPPAPSLDEVVDELFPAQAEFHPWRRANRTLVDSWLRTSRVPPSPIGSRPKSLTLSPHAQSSTATPDCLISSEDPVPAHAGFPLCARIEGRPRRRFLRTSRVPLSQKLGPTPALAGTSTRLANHAQPFRRDIPK